MCRFGFFLANQPFTSEIDGRAIAKQLSNYEFAKRVICDPQPEFLFVERIDCFLGCRNVISVLSMPFNQVEERSRRSGKGVAEDVANHSVDKRAFVWSKRGEEYKPILELPIAALTTFDFRASIFDWEDVQCLIGNFEHFCPTDRLEVVQELEQSPAILMRRGFRHVPKMKVVHGGVNTSK